MLIEVKLLILYRPNSEHASAVESFIRDFQHQHNIDEKKLEILSLNTRDGAATASLSAMSYELHAELAGK